MATLIARPADTFARISRVVFGDESGADTIRAANPGVAEPIVEGTVITYSAPALAQQFAGAGDEIYINGQRFAHWTEMAVTRTYDAFTVAEFSAPFDHNNADLVAAFRPLSFADVSIVVAGELVFTGYMLSPQVSMDATTRTVSVAAYSRAAVINDCSFSAGSFPLEFNSEKLDGIARKLLLPFGLTASFPDGPGDTFERVAPEPDENALQFFIKLAQQRGLLITDDAAGNLVFYKPPVAGVPVARLAQGEPPLQTVAPTFDDQNYFSHITALAQADVGFDGSQFTTRNALLPSIFRPLTFKASETDGANTVTAAQAKMARMLANCVTYEASVATCDDAAGNLWKAGTFVTLQAPDAFVPKPYLLRIKSVKLLRGPKSRTAQLSLILPDVPEVLPWDL